MEGDLLPARFLHYIGISTHALRMEGDQLLRIGCHRVIRFLPTPSAWRATLSRFRRGVVLPYFYPRPPHGGRPRLEYTPRLPLYFYPRPPHGGRLRRRRSGKQRHDFYPRPPHGGRHHALALLRPRLISTHALRMEGDKFSSTGLVQVKNFYPRPPHGGRQMRSCSR